MRLIKEELTGSGSCLESMTPTRINKFIDWTKKNVNVSQGEY